ncbi:MAG: ABC transporter permease [Ruminococcus sp.]
MLENIILALRGIKSHKLRSFLTMLGIIIGIASIIGIVSIVQGTNAKLEKSLVGSGNNVTTVALTSDGTNPYDLDGNTVSGIPVVSSERLDAINKLLGVVSASTYRQREYAQVYYQNRSLSAQVFGVSDSFFETMQYKVASGRDFTPEEYKSGLKAAVLEKKSAESYFPTESPVGKIIEIRSEPFLIIGLAESSTGNEKEPDSFDEYKQNTDSYNTLKIYVPENVWPVIYSFDEPQSVAIHVESTRQIVFVSRRASAILNKAITASGENSPKYASLSSAKDQNSMQEITTTISMMLLGIASLSLLVGGIGVMNIMLVSVTERTSEIGLKKALGAKNRSILVQFITESVVLTGFGGIIGVVVGIGLAGVISWITGMEFGISVPWIIISVLFSVVIGVIFGVMPAYRASKLNPIEALRRE